MSLTAAPDTVAPKIRSPKHMIQNRTKSSRAILYNLFIPVTHWFYITCSSNQQLTPQTEEHITEIKWVTTRDIKEPIKNTYPSIKDILGKFFDTP